jgi:nucleoid DNA-binding protein
MTKESFAEKIYRFHGGLSKEESHKIIQTIFGTFKKRLVKGEKVSITGFGRLEIVSRRGRKGRNPLTGDRFYIPDRRSIKFRPSKKLLDQLNGLK